ncbi:MAG: TetR/AcrR family transcriptional regulator [Acidobacteriota bacterium]|nr:TetR/AcrR family transcriptional regulator [Acidobacteriota bacterium]
MGRSDALIETVASGNAPPTHGMGRRERRAAETRLRLFRAALQLFADRGFSSVTVGDITEAADVGKGTFFNYFETKDHVLGVIAEVQLSRIREAVKSAASGRHSIYATLHHLFLRLAEEPGRSPYLARAVIASFLASEVVRGLIERQMTEARSLTSEVIAQGQKRGEIDPRLKRNDVALQLQQAILGTVLVWSLHGEPELTVWIENSFRHFWRAIAVKGGEQRP